ncbi:hypothetical protein L3X38_009584 [Prunus dulcis]|uniref:Uncharacterized protein n=1 Tax=Prunus dulcis TaxID=3755 RepID=A0AAD4ZDG0_PRUDU|nr:hypothetical protein L3X38_009584 [Prunus dulcis]
MIQRWKILASITVRQCEINNICERMKPTRSAIGEDSFCNVEEDSFCHWRKETSIHLEKGKEYSCRKLWFVRVICCGTASGARVLTIGQRKEETCIKSRGKALNIWCGTASGAS